MDVSIIIINYNTYELTKQTIESVKKYTLDIDYEIILVDNGSPDKSGDKLHGLFNDIIYIDAGENLGTSKAFNLGLTKASGKYILWLNSDILLLDNAILKMYEFMEATPDCGICGANLLDYNKEPTHSYMKKIVTLKTVKANENFFIRLIRKLLKKQISVQYNYSKKEKVVGYITGADFFVRRDVFDKIGNFDERIFMYCEEVDFSYRMIKETGYKSYNIPWVKMIHLEGASFNGKNVFSERRTRWMMIGNATYFAIHFGQKTAIKYLKFIYRSYKKNGLIFRFINKEKSLYYLNQSIVIKGLISEYQQKSFI